MLCNINCITYICLTSIGTPIPGTLLGIAAIVNNKANTYNSYPEDPPTSDDPQTLLGTQRNSFPVAKVNLPPSPWLQGASDKLEAECPREELLEHGCQATVHTGLSHLGLHLLPFASPGPWPQTTASHHSTSQVPQAQKGRGKHQGGCIGERAGGYRKWKQQDVAYLSPPSSAEKWFPLESSPGFIRSGKVASI